MTGPIESLQRLIACLSERRISFLVVLSVGSIAALVSGGAILEAPLVGGLPAGNLLAAAALCSPAGIAVALSRAGTPVRYFCVAALIAAAGWLPVSIGLAGNLTLNFSGLPGRVWLWLSLATVVVVLLALAWAAIDRLARRRALRGPARAA